MLHTRLETETAALDWNTVLVTTVTTALSKNLLKLSEKQTDTITNFVISNLNKSYSANMIIPLCAFLAILIFLVYKVVAGRRAQAKTSSKDDVEAWHEEWRAGREEWRAGQEEWRAGQVEWHAGLEEWRAGQEEWRAGQVQWHAGLEEWRAGQEVERKAHVAQVEQSTRLKTHSETSSFSAD
ncbi:hypothetical protein MJO28_006740 [Puccinia striiformis f. sp. tritici]|nr:hypothetical protein MJO28_006740 [Puccinia striiformis f. sp. tritici]